MSGRVRTEKTRTGSATTRAVRSGAEMPRNCGSSSPKTIEKTVAIDEGQSRGDRLHQRGGQPQPGRAGR